MKSIRFAFGSLVFLVFFAGASQAQVQRTFVSGLGSDGNPCSRTAPCRTFGQALMGTSAGGEVYVLDSAGYGPFTITKSITINAPQGVIAGISVFSGDGIDINAGPSDVVILRGLTVNSQGGRNGIAFNSGGTLHVEGCVVNGFSNDGIAIIAPGNIALKDTIARGNGIGVEVSLFTGAVFLEMDGLHLQGNPYGGLRVFLTVAGTGMNAAIRNSSISGNIGNSGYGLGLDASGTGVFAFLDVESCLITNNNIGVSASTNPGGSAGLSVSNCTISHNSVNGFIVLGSGFILSRGNNTIIGNGANVGSLTPLTAQ